MILSFLVQVLAGAMLLLFSVRFMRIGIERLWSARIRASFSEGSSRLANLLKGAGLGFVMQGATVVMLMAAGLAGAGSIPLKSATVLALGADLGSAFAVAFLQLPISALGPFAILIGATTYLQAGHPGIRNLGRVVLGLGLILLSLSIIRQTVAPASTVPGVAAIIGYLNSDVIAAALAGIVLTLVMHSSVAAILTALAFAGHLAFGPASTVGFVFGCNLGSSLLPFWLLHAANQRSKAVAAAVGLPRCALSAALIFGVAAFRQDIESLVSISAAEAMIAGHLAFNVVLLLLMPACLRLCAEYDKRINDAQILDDTALPPGAQEDITLALPALKRKLSEMLDVASKMLEEVTSDQPDRQALSDLEHKMNADLVTIREAYAILPGDGKDALRDMQQILDLAIRVERCGDIMAGKLHDLRTVRAQSGFRFSSEGQAEIAGLIDAVRKTVLITHETAWTGDPSAAERLVRHKQHVADLEAQSRANHLARLRAGNLTSLDSSDHHLETIAAFKEINSKFATIGYAILDSHGALKKTRLRNAASAPSA